MQKRLLICLALVALFAGCQSYSSGLQQSVARADETGAIAALRNIALAERTYSVSNEGNYATLEKLVEGGLLDARFSSDRPVKDYVLTLTLSDAADSYTCNADPRGSGETAGRHFFLDSTSTNIHVNDTQAATAADKVMQ